MNENVKRSYKFPEHSQNFQEFSAFVRETTSLLAARSNKNKSKSTKSNSKYVVDEEEEIPDEEDLLFCKIDGCRGSRSPWCQGGGGMDSGGLGPGPRAQTPDPAKLPQVPTLIFFCF